MPLWAQVLADLRVRLASGEFSAGFPPERELINQYSVSRHTMRDAMRRLGDEGIINRERGRGTFLRHESIVQRTGSLYSLFRSIEDQGFEQRSKVLRLERCVDADVARNLGVSPETELVTLHRVRNADDVPIALDEVWLPSSIAAPLLDVDFEHTGLYTELEGRCAVQPGAGWERIQPFAPSADERRLLDISSRTPAFLIERHTTFRGAPLEWRRTVIRGDLYTFVASWSDTGEQVDRPTFAPRT